MPALIEGASLSDMVEGYEKQILTEVLSQTDGNIAASASRLKSTQLIGSYTAKQFGLTAG